MSSAGERMLDSATPPDESGLRDWLGEENYGRWRHVADYIDAQYPDVFSPDWLFGGKKHGWSLRYKKSKSFCTLIPERNRFLIQIVFGQEEREKAEAILPSLVSHARADYEAATTYHDGKWLLLVVDSASVLADVERLLTIKRKPR